MSGCECERETQVADVLVREGALSAHPDLERHAAECQSCSELHEVMMLLRQGEARLGDVTVPAAGQVWWRAAIRARLEEAQAAARPVAVLQGVTAATLCGLVGGVMVLTWPVLQRGFASVAGRVSSGFEGSAFPSIVETIQRSMPLALVVVAAIVVAPLLVLYFALAGEDK